ncbi:MAG: NADH-quinone oxidoreductase subunit H [Bdellovibrionota bacterium]
MVAYSLFDIGSCRLSILFYINHAHSNMIQVVTFISKAYFLVLFIMWLRWSLPRLQIDQLMDLCWKKLIPISFICLCGVLVWVVIANEYILDIVHGINSIAKGM